MRMHSRLRLRKAGLVVEQQYSIPVYDEDGTLIGNYFADILVEKMPDHRIESL